MTQNHPERKQDEVFLGNVTNEHFTVNVDWQTKRLGVQCFNFKDEPIKTDWVFPLFVKISEVEKEIERLKNSKGEDEDQEWNIERLEGFLSKLPKGDAR